MYMMYLDDNDYSSAYLSIHRKLEKQNLKLF